MNTKNDQKVNPNKFSSWYSKRTKMERFLMIGFISLFLVIVITFIVAISSQVSSSNTCLTPVCIHEASALLKNMDESVDPCDDFYEFACGNFLKETSIPEDKSSVNSFSLLYDKVLEQIKRIVDDDLSPNTTRTHGLIKKTYDICMNKTALETDGLRIVSEVLNKLDEWPLLVGQKWNANSFDFKKVIYKFQKYHFPTSYLLSIYIGADNKNSTKRVVKVSPGHLPLSREYMVNGTNDTYVKYYFDYIVDIAVLFGADKASAESELKETLEFAIKLANITLKREKRRDPMALYNLRTLKELNRQYPFINWVEYANNILNIPNITLTENEVVIVDDLNYFNKLENIINSTPKRVLANYFMTTAYTSVVHLLPERFRNRAGEYVKKLTGKSEVTPDWKSCLGFATSIFRLSTASIYIKKYFNEKSKISTLEMINNIRSVFLNNVRNSKWMDENTKKNAIQKANAIVEYIGYPDELLDNDKVESFYSNLTINFTNYMEAINSINVFYTNYYNSKLREPINKTDWMSHSYATTVNAFYSFLENSIQFPAGILQGVFFNADRPQYMNYGAIGYIIGHEITHGFDDIGRQYNVNGNLIDWWSNKTKSAFIEKSQCIIHQYGNYTVKEVNMKLNGINTQGENIADNGGIKEAYLAYNEWVDNNGEEQKLPGLRYNPKQLFWISAANLWCSKMRKKVMQNQIKTGVHSIGRFRVIGPLSNSEYFAQDFNCPKGSAMNSIKKCEVW